MTTLPAPATDTDFGPLVEFLGLTGFVDDRTGPTSFPLGVLYPYSADLRRVCDRYAEVVAAFPATVPLLVGTAPRTGRSGLDEPPAADAVARYLSAIKTLQGRIDFAPGGVGIAVGQAYRQASKAVKQARKG
jgi:hypothetical protein